VEEDESYIICCLMNSFWLVMFSFISSMLQLLLTCVLAICGALIHMEGNKLVLHEVHILVLGMKACVVLLVSKCVG
jgi:hypothetical protein